MLSENTLSYRLVDTILTNNIEFTATVPMQVDAGAVLKVDIARVDGSNPSLDLFLQTTTDGGSTWIDVAHPNNFTAPTTYSYFTTIPAAGDAADIGEVGDGILNQSSVSGVPLLSKTVRLKALVGGSYPEFLMTADLLFPSVAAMS